MDSPVMELLQLTWDNCPYAGRSWMKFNHAMYDALKLAVTGGFKFGLNDFSDMSRFRFGLWGSKSHGDLGEGFYAMAVEHGNRSACLAFEHWKGRKPFFWWPMLDRLVEGEDRLAVGSLFLWKGQEAKVTSFTGDGLIACTYLTEEDKAAIRAKHALDKIADPDKTPREPKYPDIKNRYKITHHELAAARKEIRDQMQAARSGRQRTKLAVQLAQENT